MKTLLQSFLLSVSILFSSVSFAQLSGTYTVGGTSPNFPTLDSAFNYMELKGVTGKVRLNVRQGTYTLRTTITTISGASSSKPIQVAPDPANSGPVIFKNRITATTDNFLVAVKQGHLRFDSLDFRVDSTSKLGRIFDFTGACDNIIFNACTFYGKDSTSTVNTFATIYDVTSIKVDNLKIWNCTFHNGAFAVYHSAVSTAREVGFEFKNNRILNYYNQAVYMSLQTKPVVQGNYIIDINKYTAADGLYFLTCDSVNAKENRVFMNGGSGAAIYLSGCNGSTNSPNMIVNNFVSIYDATKTGATSGIYVTTGRYTYIYNNTVYVQGTSATSKCMYLLQSTSGQNTQARNNNLINGGAGYAIYLSSLTGLGTIDNNNYYAAEGFFAFITTGYSDMAAWRTASGKDSKSTLRNTKFTGTYDLHSIAAILNGRATPISGITTDIDGQTRHSSTPDVGADEFTPPNLDATLTYLKGNYCEGTQDVYVKMDNQGNDTIKKVSVAWMVATGTGGYSSQTTYNYTGKLISGLDTMVKIGTYNFQKNNTYKIKTWTTSPNGGTDAKPENDTLVSPTFMASLNGTYTIGGSSPDFPTIDSAFNTAERFGICGPLRFNLRSGTYKEQTVIGKIPNSSASYPVSLGPDPNNKTMPVITFAASATTNNYTLGFDNASFVKVDSIKIVATGTTYGRAVIFEGINNNISLLGDSIIGPTATTTSNNLAVIFDNTAVANKNNYMTIKDCKIMNGSYGIYTYGVSQTDMENGSKIVNNQILNFYIYGIYSYYQCNNEISGNYVKDANAYTSPIGFNIYYNDTMSLTNNQVFIGGTSAPDGINWYYSDGSMSKPSICANNVVTMYGAATGIANGLTTYEGTYNKVVYNSVNMLGGSTTSRAFYGYYTTLDSAEIFNNNFAHAGIGYAAYYGTSTGINKSNYNNYYTNGAALAYHTALARTTLSDLKTASGLDANSVSVDPKFKNQFLLKPKENKLNDKGMPLSYISKDITGATRNPNTPDIGAYEFEVFPNDIELVQIEIIGISDCGTDSIDVNAVIRNEGTKSQINFNVSIVEANYSKSYTYTHKDSLKPDQVATVYLGQFFTANGGNFDFKVYSSLSTDQDRSNDTLKVKKSLNPAPITPVAVKDSLCENSFKLLTTSYPSGTFMRWYEKRKGGQLLAESNSFLVSQLKSDTTFYVSAASSSFSSSSLGTIGTVNNGCGGGVMFDIIPKASLKLDSIQHFSNVSSDTIFVYVKKGTSIGFETSAGSWKVMDTILYTSTSISVPFIFKLHRPIAFEKDTTYGIYLSSYARYTTQASTPYSNSDLTIQTGSGLCSVWGGVNAGRAFSGKLFYRVGKECESSRVPYSIKVFPAAKVKLGKDTAYCANSGITYKLDAGPGLASYLWSTSETTQTITIKNEGTYTVDIKDTNGCTNFDDIVIKKNANPVVNIGNDTGYCANIGINYTLNAGTGYKTYKWNTASTDSSVNVSSAGVYRITVTNSVNCEAMDTVTVTENKNPVVKLGKDTTYCVNEGINLLLDAGAGFTTYNWSTLASTQTINVTSTGVYKVIVTDANLCQGEDEIFVVELINPVLKLGEDVEYCANSGINKTLDAGAGFTYKWSTGATTQTIIATGPGKYSAEIRDNNNCPDRDTVEVIANPNPIVSIGPDRVLNPALPINETLDAGAGHTSYKWSNGHIFQQIVVTTEGTYSVEVSDKKGCKSSDTIVVRYWKNGSANTLKNNQISIHPNPAKDVLNLVSQNSIIGNIVVYSATGQVIYKQNPQAAKTSINTNEWANGVYTLNISADGKSNNVRVVIQH